MAAHKNSNDGNIYIYIAYGQSGVRVYRFRTEKEPESVDVGTDDGIEWATEDLPGYYAWGEIFHADNIDAGDDAADSDELSFTSPDGNITYTNNEGYYAAKGPKSAYTAGSYVFYSAETNQTATEKDRWGTPNEFTLVTMLRYHLGKDASVKDYEILRPEDDAATMRLGDEWRMPTAQEFNNMLEQIASESETEQDGEKGILLSFKNGSELFFPFSGRYRENGYEKDESVIYRWTSTLKGSTMSQMTTFCNSYSHGSGDWGGGQQVSGWHWDVGGKRECYWSYETKAVFGGLSIKYGYEQGTDAQRERWCGMKIRPVRVVKK